jgi:hypothetical protein
LSGLLSNAVSIVLALDFVQKLFNKLRAHHLCLKQLLVLLFKYEAAFQIGLPYGLNQKNPYLLNISESVSDPGIEPNKQVKYLMVESLSLHEVLKSILA